MKSQFEVFLRIKPSSSNTGLQYRISKSSNKIELQFPKHLKYGTINNSKENADFQFTHVLDPKTTQEDVFKTVALPVITNFLNGYNGTIFAYGQTGSGKTYTMSGAESWQLRGIIPRVLSFIYDQLEAKKSFQYQLFISFIEIYNENAYDLLDKRHLETEMENWSKILLYEDEDGNIHLKNLTVNHIANEQEGIDLLMMGNFIRQVSSTPMNQSSSRSHCVFTITLEGREKGSETCLTSKLHLVDLAGSERIGKTQVEGLILNEAKYINLSLTYLEQVIIALNEKQKGFNRTHIPYRNSIMTTLLKDSLGGNCKTVMIATISGDNENLEESVSTLRFSQRVGQLENEIRRNETVDLQAVVTRLEQEKLLLIRELEGYQNKYGHQKCEISKSNLNKETIEQNVELYLNEKIPVIEITNLAEAQRCFEAMKELYNTRMKEYVTELTFISEKLQKYDEILTKKKQEQSFLDKENIHDSDRTMKSEKINKRGESPRPRNVKK